MQWWGWVVAGTIMLGAELAFIDAQFYLVFTGAAAIIVGLIAAVMPEFSPPAQWAGFALLAGKDVPGTEVLLDSTCAIASH